MDTRATTPDPYRVLVIGGRGYFGRRVVHVLRLCDGVAVAVASRAGDQPVDLRDERTFSVFEGFDVVVNCADTLRAPPSPAARWVLEHGGVWMDMGADPATAERLLALDVPDPKGHVVVGVGIFPGLLTMLGDFVAGLVGTCERIDLGVRLSTLSGAGKGNVRLMVDMLEQPGFDFADGRRRPRPALGEVRELPFVGSGKVAAIATTLPDTALVRRVTGAPNIASHIAIVPGWLRPAFALTQWLLDHAGPLRRLLLVLTEWSMTLTRRLLFRTVGTRIQLTAVANAGEIDETVRGLDFADGRDGNALGIAAAVLLWRDIEPPEPGCWVAAALFGLDEALVKLSQEGLAPPALTDPNGSRRTLGPGVGL